MTSAKEASEFIDECLRRPANPAVTPESTIEVIPMIADLTARIVNRILDQNDRILALLEGKPPPTFELTDASPADGYVERCPKCGLHTYVTDRPVQCRSSTADGKRCEYVFERN